MRMRMPPYQPPESKACGTCGNVVCRCCRCGPSRFLRLRKYLGLWLCGTCGKLRYSARR